MSDAIVELLDQIVSFYLIFRFKQFHSGLKFFAYFYHLAGIITVQKEQKPISEKTFVSEIDVVL